MSSIKKALTTLYSRTRESNHYILHLNEQTRYVILSDHHKGAGNRADAFWQNKNYDAYHMALASYYERGFTLVILGDSEEHWKQKPKRVFKAHRGTFDLEEKFFSEKRYHKVWGNHDHLWGRWSRSRIEKEFSGAGDFKGLQITEGLLFDVVHQNTVLGELFLTHGHQGTFDSDVISVISKRAVRFLGFLQKTFGAKWWMGQTPSENYNLRKKHDIEMYEWSAEHNGSNDRKLIFITGHTHRPVFSSETHVQYLDEQIRKKQIRRDKAHGAAREKLTAQIIGLRSEKANRISKDSGDSSAYEMSMPSYFNTGCCIFRDGDITGIEIVYEKARRGSKGDVYIKLVRWPDDNRSPRAKVLRSRKLNDVFKSISKPD
jgi:predicted phosphodiesterase